MFHWSSINWREPYCNRPYSWWVSTSCEDNEPVSGPTSLSWSVSVTTSIEPATTSTEPVSILPVIQCIDPPISECAIELNSSCSYFMYPIANSTSLEEETMRYMCGKYPHLKEAFENAWTSGTRWDDTVNLVMTSRDVATTPTDSLSGRSTLTLS